MASFDLSRSDSNETHNGREAVEPLPIGDAHDHDQNQPHPHGHTHGTVDLALYQSTAGLRVVIISTVGMAFVALIQFSVFFYGGSAGLFADSLHNFGDIFTTIALWVAFVLATRPPTKTYTFGFHRAEDLAGIFILLIILISAVSGAVESVMKLVTGSVPVNIPLSMVAALVGVVGNEIMAQYKIATGKRIQSMPLIADGHHSRIDGLASFAAFIGLLFAHFGITIADPLAGIVISCIILDVVYSLGKNVFRRILDAVDPVILDQVHDVAKGFPEIHEVDTLRVRWVGHTLHLMMEIHVEGAMTIGEENELIDSFKHAIMHRIENISEIFICPVACRLTDDPVNE